MRKSLSILLLLVLMPAVAVMSLIFSFKANVFKADFIKEELSSSQIYSILEDSLATSFSSSDIVGALPLSKEVLNDISRRAISASWLKSSAEGTIDDYFKWVDEPNNTPLSLPVDLSDPKREFFSGLDYSLGEWLNDLPNCTIKMIMNKEFCRQPGMNVAQIKDLLKLESIDLVAIQGQVPDKIDLADPNIPVITLTDGKDFDLAKEISPFIQFLIKEKDVYNRIVKNYSYAAIACFVLILLYLILNIKGLKRFLRWFGIMFVSFSVLPLVMDFASRRIIEKTILANQSLSSGSGIALSSVLPGIIRDFRAAEFSLVLAAGIASLVIGIALIVASFSLKTKVVEEVKEGN